MAVDMDEFRRRYGKIRYLESIQGRHPVKPVCRNDANRRLMIKFKYGNMTKEEEFQFHESIKKMIYKVMHKNNVMMEWEDVYQEIWKKIVKSRHTWKEWKGTMVSTWIVIVANSVINTLRQNVNKYNSRFFRYDDIASQNTDSDDEEPDGKMDALAYSTDDERMEDDGIRKLMFAEQYEDFRSRLDPAESMVFDIILSMQDDILDSYDRRLKVPYGELKAKSGYDDATFALVIYGIKRKYCEAFGLKFDEFTPPDPNDGSETEFLF